MPVFSKGNLNSGFAMRSKSKDLHQSSTLVHLLPVAVKKASDEVKAELRRRTAIQDSIADPDQEAKARRQAQLEQRHLEAYRNMHRLRDALHSRYAALLKEKVHSQRLLLQQRNDTARVKSENEMKQKQKKLAFSKLQHNDSYLKSLPKTSYYLIFDLQKQLAERGHLKTHNDLEDFYRCIKYRHHPSQLHKSLEDVRKRMLGSRSAADLMTQYKTSEKHPCAAEETGREDHISQSRLSEQRSGSEESSAELIFGGSQEKDEIEQMFPKVYEKINTTLMSVQLSEQRSGSEESSAELIFGGSQEKDEIEQMFPKMKAPTFATLQPNFMRNFQSKMPDLIISEIPEKSRKAEIYLRRLRQMHDLCLTNMDFSQRLLDRETDSLYWQEERGDQDLVLPGIDSKQGKMSQTNQPPPCSLKQPRSVLNDQPSCPQRQSRTTLTSRRRFETLVWDTAVCCRKTPDPLSIEDVCQQKHVEIIDCGFKLWRNYAENTDH
ncbi:uncharacterized protein si:ch211-130h14.4 [Micropterus dolomieu]|uniref:uncharacterized protein si:ch211-130h14.4 n=1 Tax=Micropterus dolomieu TaxID=147949 RepID=UPI001E8D2F38|nr:uncharacterized protein si:ch211-130h14.4 [Micropterus dolomieu]